MHEEPYIKLLKETPDAWLLLLDDSDFLNYVKEWFPKSQCELCEDIVLVPEWLAIEKGLV